MQRNTERRRSHALASRLHAYNTPAYQRTNQQILKTTQQFQQILKVLQIVHILHYPTNLHLQTASTYSTEWQKLIRCLKLQVIFHKRATNHRAILREMTCKDKAFYASSPPSIYTVFATLYLNYKHTIARCGRVLPLIEYYALRCISANLLHLNLL